MTDAQSAALWGIASIGIAVFIVGLLLVSLEKRSQKRMRPADPTWRIQSANTLPTKAEPFTK